MLTRAEAKAAAEHRALALVGAAELIAVSQHADRIKALLAIAGQRPLLRAVERVRPAVVPDVEVGSGTPDREVWAAQTEAVIGGRRN